MRDRFWTYFEHARKYALIYCLIFSTFFPVRNLQNVNYCISYSFTFQILVVIEPLLIDEDYYARVEGREIISNLAKAAGLATMISTMRPDIDNIDEYVRNTTARAFAVVASALGTPSLLPFLKAVCKSKKSWQARHTGIKIVQQIAILMGCAILPHLRNLVEIIEHGKCMCWMGNKTD